MKVDEEKIIFVNPVINHPELQTNVSDDKTALRNLKLEQKVKKTVSYVHESALQGKKISSVYVDSAYNLM